MRTNQSLHWLENPDPYVQKWGFFFHFLFFAVFMFFSWRMASTRCDVRIRVYVHWGWSNLQLPHASATLRRAGKKAARSRSEEVELAAVLICYFWIEMWTQQITKWGSDLFSFLKNTDFTTISSCVQPQFRHANTCMSNCCIAQTDVFKRFDITFAQITMTTRLHWLLLAPSHLVGLVAVVDR